MGGWSVGRLVGRLVVGRSVDLATPHVDQPASGGGKSTGGLSYSATLNLVCQLVGRSVGWSVGRLLGRLLGEWASGWEGRWLGWVYVWHVVGVGG